MPHSPSISQSSINTFDLGDGDRPMSAGGESARTKRASSNYGVALTSTPSQDERSALPSQQKANAWKRKSAPGAEYAELISPSSFNFDELRQRGPGDRNSVHSISYHDTSRRRPQYYEEQLPYKNNIMTQSREKLHRQSPVIAELKTNVIIKDEFTLVTDLSYHLAQRYARPDSCIMIRVDHSACLALGGNFEPCYLLTINAVPSQTSPSTNKRNAALVQAFLADILSVSADRGIVTFNAIAEENIAINGTTLLSDMERLDKRNSVNDPTQLKSAIKDATRRSMTFPKATNPKLNGDFRSNGNLTAGSTSSPSITPPPPTQLNDKPRSATEQDGRPSTAHGGFDGLRMNGISTEMLAANNARLPNGRPKTFGGSTPSSTQGSIKQEPLPHVSRQTNRQPQRASMTPTSSTKITPTSTSTTTTTTSKPNGALAPRPVQLTKANSSTSTATAPAPTKPKHTPIIAVENRPNNTYLDNTSSLTKKNPTPALKVDEDEDDIPLAKTAAGRANTAKRRSTITATPALPDLKSKPQGPLKPPPVPDETKSMSSRLSKRKSFLRMFKRTSVPAWYEQ